MLNPKAGSIFIIIDAIDECEPVSRERILTAIRYFLTKTTKQSSSFVKLLISSRNKVDIVEEIRQYSRVINLDNAVEVRDVERDVDLVVKDQLDELAKETHWPKETRENLERSIVTKADRNFLWVRLVIQRLKRGPQTKKYFEQVINESPKDLDRLYCTILVDIEPENQDLAAKILRILVGSLRPLTLAELRLAMAIDAQHFTFRSVEDDSDMAIERTVRIILGPLVRIYDVKVHLVHQSAKEFLLRLLNGKVADLEPFKPRLRAFSGTRLDSEHLELATACIRFLELADYDETGVLDDNVPAFLELPGPTEESPWFLMQRASEPLSGDSSDSAENSATTPVHQTGPFFEYSASHWTTHFRALGASIPQELLQSSMRLSEPRTNRLANWSNQYRLSSKDWVLLPNDLDALIVASFFGLIQLANAAMTMYSSEPRQQESRCLALSWACRMGHMDVVKTLLDNGTPVSGARVEGSSPISWACTCGYLNILKLLLEHVDSSQINVLDGNGRSPLSLAVGSGHLDITNLLIARQDVDVNLADRTESSPLLWAIGRKVEKKDLMLLESLVSEPRVNIAQRDRYGRTVLSWAAEMGASDAISILLGSTRPDIQSLLDDSGDTGRVFSPLSWAAYNGHVQVVKLLCMSNRIYTQLASIDKTGQNAVSLAADRNHGDIIKVLAQFYPQGIDYPEESGRTPLSCAMWGSPSNAGTVRALLQTGLVDVNMKAFNGRTPLSYAAAVGWVDLVRILVEEGGADMDILDDSGNAPGDLNIDWRSSQVKDEIDRLRRSRLRRVVK